MRLLIVRHAEAVAPDAAGGRDADRPLTANGERAFRVAALGIARRMPAPDVLLASPLRRAQQTAAMLAHAWGGIAVTSDADIASGRLEGIIGTLAERPDDAAIALVGHEPTVSALLAELVGAEAKGFSPGAAALVEEVSIARRAGRLVWFLSPEAAATRA